MSQQLVCSQCGYIGGSQTGIKGNWALEIVLWLCFIIPGIIYSIWRSSSRYKKCPSCGSANLIPIDSPVGRKILTDQGKTVEEVKDEVKKQGMPIKKKIIIGIVCFVVFIFLIVLYNIGNSTISEVSTPEPVVAKQETIFDVPSLVGKDLSGLVATLGTPTNNSEPTQTQLKSGLFDTWEKSWHKDGYFLMATYNLKTKKVVDLFLGADADRSFENFKNTDNILKVGNLSMSDSNYSVEFVKARNTTGYTGAIITKK